MSGGWRCESRESRGGKGIGEGSGWMGVVGVEGKRSAGGQSEKWKLGYGGGVLMKLKWNEVKRKGVVEFWEAGAQRMTMEGLEGTELDLRGEMGLEVEVFSVDM